MLAALMPACCEFIMTPPKNDPVVRSFRDSLGMFPTGVTVVTARSSSGEALGLTISSFNSVSLAPPLVVWSLASHLPSLPIFEAAEVYAINVLAEDQQEMSQRFATRSDDKFAGLDFTDGIDGVPLLPGCSAWFECRQFSRHPGGDHVVFIGEVIRFDRQADKKPLVFQGGAYHRLA
jgi:3-hydroxy-9,10-secoandrosta-1,3,5(10)-triene-9,17-dione monooxygenase reductase component